MSAVGRASIGNERSVLVLMLIVILGGVISLGELPREENPKIKNRTISIHTYFSQASADQVELNITRPLEDAISQVQDIDSIFSVSEPGHSRIRVTLKDNAPIGTRFEQIRIEIQRARVTLPSAPMPPDVVIDDDILRTYGLVIGFELPEGMDMLTYSERLRILQSEISQIDTVRKVSIWGESERELYVQVSPSKAALAGVSIFDVAEAIRSKSGQSLSGELRNKESRTGIRVGEPISGPADLDEIVIPSSKQSRSPVQLNEIASFVDTERQDQPVVRINGTRAIVLAIESQPGSNVSDTNELAMQVADDYIRSLSDSVEIHVVSDESQYSSARVNNLGINLILGVALVLLITFYGLGWRSGIVAASALPLVACSSLWILNVLNQSLNQISLAAMVFSIGLIVDESIIATENMQRWIGRDGVNNSALVGGLGEVEKPLVSGALSTIIALAPLLLMSGATGDFLKAIPIVVTAMIVSSLVYVHFFAPVLIRRIHILYPSMRHVKPNLGVSWYSLSLKRVCRNSKMFLFATTLFATILTVIGIRAIFPPILFPDSDRKQVIVIVEMPANATVTHTDSAVQSLLPYLASVDNVKEVFAFSGSGIPKFYYNEFTEVRGNHIGMLLLETNEPPREQFVRNIEEDLQRIAVRADIKVKRLQQGFASGSDVTIYIQGSSQKVLRQIAHSVELIARKTDGVREAKNSFGHGLLEYTVRDESGLYGYTVVEPGDITRALESWLVGVHATSYVIDDHVVPITVGFDPLNEREYWQLQELMISKTAVSSPVMLSSFLDFAPTVEAQRSTRYQRRPVVEVAVFVEEGESRTNVAKAIEREMANQLSIPDDYFVSFGGQSKQADDSFSSMLRAALISTLLIFMLLVHRFDSLLRPLYVLAVLPFCIAGSMVALAVLGESISFAAALGIVSIVGVVVNDAIVLLDFTSRRDADGGTNSVVATCRIRYPAILLTTTTTVASVTPLAFLGDSFFFAFAIAVIGGLLLGMLATLYVVPALIVLTATSGSSQLASLSEPDNRLKDR